MFPAIVKTFIQFGSKESCSLVNNIYNYIFNFSIAESQDKYMKNVYQIILLHELWLQLDS